MHKTRKRIAIDRKVHEKIKKKAGKINRTVNDLAEEMLEKNKGRYQNADNTNR